MFFGRQQWGQFGVKVFHSRGNHIHSVWVQCPGMEGAEAIVIVQSWLNPAPVNPIWSGFSSRFHIFVHVAGISPPSDVPAGFDLSTVEEQEDGQFCVYKELTIESIEKTPVQQCVHRWRKSRDSLNIKWITNNRVVSLTSRVKAFWFFLRGMIRSRASKGTDCWWKDSAGKLPNTFFWHTSKIKLLYL